MESALEEKTCSRCKQTLLITFFRKRKANKNGISGVCKNCTNKDRKEYVLRNFNKIKKRRKKAIEKIKKLNYSLTNKEIYNRIPFLTCRRCKKELPSREFYINRGRPSGIADSNCKKCSTDLERYTKYKISSKEVEKIMVSQEEKCAICKNKKRLCVDHNHKTEEVRGMLCSRCNQGIGLFLENKNYLLNAILYIEKWNEKCT